MKGYTSSSPCNEVRDFIAAARLTKVSIQELANLWRMTQVSVLCPGAAWLGKNPNTPARVRGAWLSALGDAASDDALQGAPCSWSPPCAYDIFHNTQGKVNQGVETPRPFVIGMDSVGTDLKLTLTLFGAAESWAGEAADALLRGLRNGLDEKQRRRPVPIGHRTVTAAQGVPLTDLRHGAILRFRSPVTLRQGDAVHLRPASLLKSLSIRICGLAQWHGVSLNAGTSAADEAESLGAAAEWHVVEVPTWQRGFARQGNRKSMVGAIGELWLPPPSPYFGTVLTLGQTTHAGGSASIGLGRFELLAPAF